MTAGTGVCATSGPPITNVATPTDFGASGNDGRDHTDAFEKALAKSAGGALLLPPGTFNIRANRVHIPYGTSLLGLGRGSVLRRIDDGTLLDFSGVSPEQHNGACLVRDVVLDGADHCGPLVCCYYAHDMVFENVWSRSNADIALDVVELWDSRFINRTWDWCSAQMAQVPRRCFAIRSTLVWAIRMPYTSSTVVGNRLGTVPLAKPNRPRGNESGPHNQLQDGNRVWPRSLSSHLPRCARYYRAELIPLRERR